MVENLSDTLNKLITDAYAFAKAKTINLETQDEDAEGSADCINYEAHQKRQKVEPNLTTRVLRDLFHIMDRLKVPMHHNFKTIYFRIFGRHYS